MNSRSKLYQPGILGPVPPAARHLFFSIVDAKQLAISLRALRAVADGTDLVCGIGSSVTNALGRDIEGLRVFPAHSAGGVEVPSTPAALWCWLRGRDRGELVLRGRDIENALAPGLRLDNAIDTFRYQEGRDLTGYVDGTENPKGKAATDAAFSRGASFAAIQQWLHDFDRFAKMSAKQQDHTIGRRRRDDVEIGNAPASAHVKRTAQEDYEPPAFMLRRSMPWAEGARAGLLFLAFGNTLDAFEAQIYRMSGAEDGIVDALYSFTRPLTGAYFWCPPMRAGRLDLRALGL